MNIENSEIVIGIFGSRFGTPVQDAQSETAHELQRAIAAWRETGRPHIMVYFRQRLPTEKSISDLDQLREVLAFRESFPQEGLWWSYKSSSEFERLVRQHIQDYLRREYGGRA